jgi:NAD(P)-dependent dehydrogenase (short-subunit alcohol dehydrogenase family)
VRRPRPSITGRPAVITGAASGIGRSLTCGWPAWARPWPSPTWTRPGLDKTAASLRCPVLSRVVDVRDAAGQLRFAAEVREWLPGAAGGGVQQRGRNILGEATPQAPRDQVPRPAPVGFQNGA